MKKWFLPVLAGLLMLAGCGALRETPEQRAERQMREAAYVHEHIPAADFKIQIDRMIPLRGMSRTLSSPYWIKVKDGVLDSTLPYFGEAWQVPYGGGHALNFEAPIVHYEYGMNRKGGYEILIYVKTDEDEHIYSLTVFDNGSASLDVQSRNRERISYTGTVDFLAE